MKFKLDNQKYLFLCVSTNEKSEFFTIDIILLPVSNKVVKVNLTVEDGQQFTEE